MDDFLAAIGVQAMRYAIRSGIALTSSYAISQCSRLLNTVDDKSLHSELRSLQKHLSSKIRVISPAIDLIELKSGRGNIFLESALPLAKSLHQRIVSLGRRVEAAAAAQEYNHHSATSPIKKKTSHDTLQKVVRDLKNLLEEIDREVPLLQLAISASGESLSTSLPTGISPSRLLQASTLLIVGDTQHTQEPHRLVQIGPSFTLSLYMLFVGHASVPSTTGHVKTQPDAESDHRQGHLKIAELKTQDSVYGIGMHDRRPLWQEVIHTARVRLCRSASSPAIAGLSEDLEYAYHLEIVENLDDGRAHEGLDSSQPYNGIPNAGIRELIPLHQLTKIFYTDTGRILNIGDRTDGDSNPVLLLKRDINASRLPRLEFAMSDEMNEASNDRSQQEPHECDQVGVDRQLFEESQEQVLASEGSKNVDDTRATAFPKHLDPEWIAFEVFEDDDESGANSDYDTDTSSPSKADGYDHSPTRSPSEPRTAMDSNLISQIKNLSVQPGSRNGLVSNNLDSGTDRSSRGLKINSENEAQDFVSRSPFGAITTSLSLIEMLIRLAGLQEFQQASHLSIPDHILTFFLEETSTTGLTGEAMWKARNETKQRVGFDPYTDTT